MVLWVPRILRPDYTWPRPIRPSISTRTPPTPTVTRPIIRRFWAKVHRFSKLYRSWFDIPYDGIHELPFGLILKWSDRTRIEEAVATQMARSAGMPVPKILCYGEDPSDDFMPVSILMTRLPGWSLDNCFEPFDVEEEQPWFEELSRCVKAMRQWESPFPQHQISSAIGSSIITQRVPGHSMGPFANEDQMYDYLFAPVSKHGFSSPEEFDRTLSEAQKFRRLSHQVTFTHGDLKAHNLLVDEDYRLSGFLDWECAGWCPEYWDFTTSMLLGRDSWWHQAMSILSEEKFAAELNHNRALHNLTCGSYVGM